MAYEEQRHGDIRCSEHARVLTAIRRVAHVDGRAAVVATAREDLESGGGGVLHVIDCNGRRSGRREL